MNSEVEPPNFSSQASSIDITHLLNPLEEIMKNETRNNKKDLFRAMTPEQAATVNGGRQGVDDPAGHVRRAGEPTPHA
jgi:hypothetical protein